MEKREFDVIIIGSGAAGLTCATVAQQQGLECLVVEKADMLGGTTAYSGGAVWISCNPQLAGTDQQDTLAEAETYLKAVLGNHYDADILGAFLESGPQMLRYMEENSHVRFLSIPLSDYRPELPGAKIGRTMLSREFDGRVLGNGSARCAFPLPAMSPSGRCRPIL